MPIFPNEYLVLDVETNGLSSLRDDLLSISIYQPDTGKMYNKFLPLELSNNVYTTHINGITKKDLKNATPLTQEDVDALIIEWELDKRTILTYGNIDEKFIKNYFKRKNIDGFQKLRFYNFKRNIISSSFSGGNVTKDNLCNIYGVSNVQQIHTGATDCLLEWELFKKMNNNKLFVTRDQVFEFSDDYIIPVSYLSTYPNFKYHITNLPHIKCTHTQVKRFEITNREIKKFPTNFNGMMIEHLINSMLCVETIDSSDFLIKNKSKLKYIGKLPSVFDEVLLNFQPDGTVKAVLDKDKETADELNHFVLMLKQKITPLIAYIAQDIFGGEKIHSQELVVHKEQNVLALCDLSNQNSVLEIKTYGTLDVNKFKEQLFYQSNGRHCYILQIDWDQLPKKLGFIISEVDVGIGESPKGRATQNRKDAFKQRLNNDEIEVIEYINTTAKVKLKCNKCGNEWQCGYNTAIKKPFCPLCSPKLTVEHSSKPIITEKEKQDHRARKFAAKVHQKSNENLEIVEYLGSKENTVVKCQICGYVWNIRADHLLSRPHCPRCRRTTK